MAKTGPSPHGRGRFHQRDLSLPRAQKYADSVAIRLPLRQQARSSRFEQLGDTLSGDTENGSHVLLRHTRLEQVAGSFANLLRSSA